MTTNSDRVHAGSVEQPWVTVGDNGDPDLLNHLDGEGAPNYRRYEFDLVAPYVGRSMLEVGSGLGHFAEQFRDRLDRLVVSDADPYCVQRLRQRWADDPAVSVAQFTLPDVAPVDPVDTVVAMNVLEHVEADVEALRRLAKVVTPGGRLVMWVPAYMSLYGEFDRAVGHVTRYTPRTLGAAFAEAGLTTEVCKPVNVLGGIAWWFAVRLGRASYPRPAMVKAYDRLIIPTTRALERVVAPRFGQTVLGVARVPG